MRLIIGREDLLDESKNLPVGSIGLKDLNPNAIQAILADNPMRFVFEDQPMTSNGKPYYQAVNITSEERKKYAYLYPPVYMWLKDALDDWLHTWDDELIEAWGMQRILEDKNKSILPANYPVALAALVNDMDNEIRILSLAEYQLIVYHLWQKFSNGG